MRELAVGVKTLNKKCFLSKCNLLRIPDRDIANSKEIQVATKLRQTGQQRGFWESTKLLCSSVPCQLSTLQLVFQGPTWVSLKHWLIKGFRRVTTASRFRQHLDFPTQTLNISSNSYNKKVFKNLLGFMFHRYILMGWTNNIKEKHEIQ